MKNTLMRMIGSGLNGITAVAPRTGGMLGFQLFCYPFRIPITKKQRVFLNTATRSSFPYKGDRIQTYRWGKGSKNILLLHGWQSHTYRWKKYIELLNKQDYSIYAFDAPGHGLSGGKFLSVPLYSEIIEHYIHHIGTMEAIISHSLGSFSTLYLLYQNPALTIRKIVAMASPGEATEFFDFYKKALHLSEKTIHQTIDHFKERLQNTPDYFSAPRFAAALTVPGLIIHDEEDRETDVTNSMRLHQSWKKSELIVTKGFGHNLKSPQVVKKVIDFVHQPLISE